MKFGHNVYKEIGIIIFKMEQKISFWQVIFYLSLLVITIWVILKSVGIIQTPFWLEYGVPIAGFVITFLAFYNNLIEKMSQLTINFVTLNSKVDHIDKYIEFLKKDVEFLKKDVSFLKNKISA